MTKLAYLILEGSLLEESAAFTCSIVNYLVLIIIWQHKPNPKGLSCAPGLVLYIGTYDL